MSSSTEHNPSPALAGNLHEPLSMGSTEMRVLVEALRTEAQRLGFADIGISDIDLSQHEAGLMEWLQQGFHGEMHYMQTHGLKRARPAELEPGTVRVITARMNYASISIAQARSQQMQAAPERAVISLYAQGRDYHKVLRARLAQLADFLRRYHPSLRSRVFTDSAPVMEVALAEQAGLGWRGKHTLLIHREAGSLFFLGEIFINLPLPIDTPSNPHCGQCRACLDACPTGAIVAPYQLDARRCISYLTIELRGSIPIELRPLIGNRVYGCDDCQLVCPWNKFAQITDVPDFSVRHGLDRSTLLELFTWDEAEFLRKMEGSAIRRIGHEMWLRNLAVGLGNAAQTKFADPAIVQALQARLSHDSHIVREHVRWALERHGIEN